MTPPDRLRFAPSPTGYLHVGNARAFLFNWLHARRTGGEFLLRIEDTDTERNRPELVDNILEMIRWLGLDWDGEPVHQSERSELYRRATNRLADAGHAYHCDCTPEAINARAAERGGPPGYDGFCRDRGLGAGDGRALRFRTPDEDSTGFDDLIRGRVSFENSNLEDFVLLRSSGAPTFLLANAVDDADMGITHVVRGEEHVNGTPKYLLITRALELDHHPVFAHLPVLVNEARKKLSKRRDSVAVGDFRDRGFLPEAMVNYLCLLGWGPADGVEIRPLREIVAEFRLEDVTASPAFFDERKLEHVNGEYIRALPTGEFLSRVEPFVHTPEAMEAVRAMADEVRDRVRTLAEAEDLVDFLLPGELEVDEASWQKGVLKHGDRSASMIEATIAGFESCDWDAASIRSVVEAAGVSAGFTNQEGRLQLAKAQAPVRVATTGSSVGPPLFESLEVLGRERALDRLRSARLRL